ncbi:uncharacterized protein LOC121855908 isoform X2 [Homarus americanus]|uniref:uncharacterized protein LOC121855908 isoform X2 n=1 Tax=Homarus americanus TaxID=6706 RepID=UPI001C493E2A|nr:uncharacterized protein LOC121855908 isoform X2 [Homarus americanus]
MHLPLLLSCDTLLKKKNSWTNLHWIGEDARKVYLVSRQFLGEVDLRTGCTSKIQKLSHITKTAAAVNYTYDGTYIYGILTSGDIFFWNQTSEFLSQALGIPALVTHGTCSTGRDSHDGPLQAVQDFFKQLKPQNLGNNETTENVESAPGCSSPSHYKPNIFASSDCSKVIVVLGASQVYLWEKDLTKPCSKNSSTIPGHWSVVLCHSGIPLPSLLSRETQVTSCFLLQGSQGKQCHTTFSFVDNSCLIMTTLTLQWEGSGCLVPPAAVVSAFWNYISVSHQTFGMRENELLQRKGTLISQYAHGQCLISIAVNSLQQHSKLLYLHPMCSTVVVANVSDAVGQQDLYNANNSKSHWVSDLAWCRDNTYVVGCLRSGSVFIATRMGPLVKISCSGENLQLQAAMMLPVHPYSATPRIDSCNENLSESSDSSPSRLTFSVSCHPVRDQFLLSSGLRVSVLALPENGRRDAEVVDQLLATAHHALYLLRHSSLTHDYAYIRCSTWRLARSVLDLSQNINESLGADESKIHLWGKKNQNVEECKTYPDVATEGEHMIVQVMKPLVAAWTFIASHTGPQTQDWRKRPKHVAKQLVKLISTLMQTTLNGDYSEHQAQLLQMLHVFHHFVKVLAVWPRSLHMIRPTLWLTHQIIHTFLSCERHAGESSMIDTLLILTQALSSVESTLAQIYAFRPVLKSSYLLRYSNVDEAPGIEQTNINAISCNTQMDGMFKGDPAVCEKMKNLWMCLYVNSVKVYTRLGEKKFERASYQKSVAVMNITQCRLQKLGCDFNQRKVKLKRCNQLYLNGIYHGAIEEWKSEIIQSLTHEKSRKKICQYLHSILYTYLLYRDFIGISNFFSWLYTLLSSDFSVQNQSSHLNGICSTPKTDRSIARHSELDLDISPIKKETIKKGSQEVRDISRGSVLRKKSKETSEQEFKSSASKINDSETRNQESDSSGGEFQLMCNLNSAARRMIGSFGRILAEVFLQRDIHIPSPHTPHLIPPIWIDYQELKDRGIGTTALSPTIMKDVIHEVHWSTEVAAQALAIAGYWSDLTVLSLDLGDARTALLSSLVAVIAGKHKVPVPSSLHPSTLIKNYVLHYGPMEDATPSVFHSYQELIQVASMTCLEVLPDILEECLQKVQEVMQLLEVLVLPHVYLPAPPVFCPQVTSCMEDTPQLPSVSIRYDERTLRKELAGWVRVFSCVISAAGLAQPLLLDLSHTLQHNPEKIRATGQGNTTEILTWVFELHKLIDSDSWRDELIATALTAASNSPPLPVIAQALAMIIPKPSQLPSLLKNKAKRLFDLWKTTNVMVTEIGDSPQNEEDKSGENESLIDTCNNLYSIYEKKCSEEIEIFDVSSKDHIDPHKDNRRKECNGLAGDTPYTFRTTSEDVEEEFRKFVFLFASMTFARDAEMFPQKIEQVPQLVQFSEEIKKREFQGMKIKRHVYEIKQGVCTENSEHNILYDTNNMSLLNVSKGKGSTEKKGLFRNLDYSKIWQGDIQTVFHLERNTSLHANSSQSYQRKQNTSLPQKKQFINQRNSSSNTGKDKEFSSRYNNSGSRKNRSRSSAERKQDTSSASLKIRSRSASLPRLKERSNLKHININDRTTSSTLSPSSPLSNFLHISKSHNSDMKNNVLRDRIKLVQWLMSSERKFSLPTKTANTRVSAAAEHTTIKKVDLDLDDIVLALRWEYLSKPNLYNTPLRKVPVALRHEKKQSVEVSIDGHNKRKGSPKLKQTLKVAEPSPDITNGTQKANVGRGFITSPNSTQEDEHLVKTAVKKAVRKINYPKKANLTTKKVEKDPQNAVNVITTTTEQNYDWVQEEEEQSQYNQMTSVADTTQGNQDREAFYSLHKNEHNSPVDLENSDVSQENGIGLLRNFPDKCKQEVAIDEQDGKVSDIMNKNTSEIDQPSSTRSTETYDHTEKESKKTVEKMKPGVKDIRKCSDGQWSDASVVGVSSEEAAVREEKHPGHPVNEAVDKVPSKLMSEKSHIKSSQTLKEKNITFKVISPEREEDSEIKKDERDISRKSRSKSTDTGKALYRQDAPEAVSQYPASKSIWRPFRARNKGYLKPPLLVLEVEDAGKPILHNRKLSSDRQKKNSLTPIETPSEIYGTNDGVSPKLLHMPSTSCQGSKRLTISDLNDNDTISTHQSMALPVDDTLDDVTLPDSLHGSDLEGDGEYSLSSQNIIQENIIKKHKFQFPKRDLPRDVPRKYNTTITLKKPVNLKQTPQWDEKELYLKPIPVRVKCNSPKVHDSGEKSTDGQGETRPVLEKNAIMNRKLKLLTLPKHSPQNVENTQHYPTLVLKRLPADKLLQVKSKSSNLFTVPDKGHSDYPGEMYNNNHHINLTKQTPPKKLRHKDMKLLTLPTCSYTQLREGSEAQFLNLLDPNQVFAFYKRNMTKKQNRFKTLKINEPIMNKNLMEVSEKESCIKDQTVNNGVRVVQPSVQESLDKGFLEEIKKYSDKYEGGAYKNILTKGYHENGGTVKSRLQYEVTQRLEKINQSESRHVWNTKETQTSTPCLTDFQITKHLISDEETTPIDSKGTRAQEDIICLRGENEMAERHNGPGSPKGQLHTKALEKVVIKVKDSWTETSSVNLNQNIPVKSCEIQTQTEDRPLKSVSVCTDIATSPQAAPPTHSLPQQILPVTHHPQSLENHSSPIPATYETLAIDLGTKALNTSSKFVMEETATGGIAHIVDLPQEIVQQHLEEIRDELNKTIQYQEPDTVEQRVKPSSGDANGKVEVLRDTVKILRDDKVDDKVRRLDSIGLNTNRSSLETNNLDKVFKYYESQRNRNQGLGKDEENILQAEAIHTGAELSEDDLPVTRTRDALEERFIISDQLNMNEIFEAFYNGRITFEDLYKISSDLPMEALKVKQEEEIVEKRVDIQDIQRLEQQTVEAARGLCESHNLLSKVSLLLQTSEKLEEERVKRDRSRSLSRNRRYSSSERKKIHSHVHTNNTSFENLGWQETLSTLRESGNSDILLRFVENVNPEDITDEMIDEIIKYEESNTERHLQHRPLCSQDTSNFLSNTFTVNRSSRRNNTNTLMNINRHQGLLEVNYGDSSSRKDEGSSGGATSKQPTSNCLSPEKNSGTFSDEIESNVNELCSGTDTPKLHLDLTGLRSSPSTSPARTSCHNAGRWLESAYDTSEKRQQRRAEIRAWMKKQRRKRLEKTHDVPNNTITKSQLNTYRNLSPSQNHGKMMENSGTIKKENQDLSGRQLREKSQEREERRAQLREDHQRKREKDVAKLLADHEEELITHRSLIMRNLPYESPRMSREALRRKIFNNTKSNERQHNLTLQNSYADTEILLPSGQRRKTKQKSNFGLSQVSDSKLNTQLLKRKGKSPQGKGGMQSNTDVWKNKDQTTYRTDDLSSLSMSSARCEDSTDRNRTNLIGNANIERVDGVQSELDNLIKCLKSPGKRKVSDVHEKFKEKHIRPSSSPIQTKNFHGRRNERKAKEQKSLSSSDDDNIHQKPSSETYFPVNTTFQLPLDRISEVDSNVSATSSPVDGSGCRERDHHQLTRPDEDNTQHKDTSSESSWNIPDDVKKLLYD